ncbi:glycerol-3-phosphate 1-O-acyltransferase PlsY [Pleionea sediminis]|uniref:glycerol-3-phosphate 1-O-acyltransferase PlsY n=1 Tax=Pleionea sediminis TaxID=2569479 RepID=UPI00118634ED|nr:glycerol-3-phosphate 1-O-acyltransferase PlsY [Pleionea sediminis]
MDALAFSLIIAAYLLGSVSSAILICQLFGFGDPRDSGSGNPGATNVLRIGGKKAAFLTLLGDSLKGAAPVAATVILEQPIYVVGLVGLAAFIGHLFPVFFRFQGGKGVATFFGVIMVMNWQLGMYSALCWFICAWAFRISSLSALITALTVPFYAWYFFPKQFIFLLLMCVLLVFRHHQNIRNMVSGSESKLGTSS